MKGYPKLLEGVEGNYGYKLADTCEVCIHCLHLSGIPHCKHPVDGKYYRIDEECVCNHYCRLIL